MRFGQNLDYQVCLDISHHGSSCCFLSEINLGLFRGQGSLDIKPYNSLLKAWDLVDGCRGPFLPPAAPLPSKLSFQPRMTYLHRGGGVFKSLCP